MDELINKIKKTIANSSFPMEMKIANFLLDDGWAPIIGRPYYDYESDKLSENDIVARKEINCVQITLFIECKKSMDKQLILYAPYYPAPFSDLLCLNAKYFPIERLNNQLSVDLEFSTLMLSKLSPFYDLKTDNLIANNLIFTKGNNIVQDNHKFFSSLNGLVKSTFWFRNKMSQIPTKEIYLYIVVYDGSMFGLIPKYDNSEIFDIIPTDYGIYNTEMLFDIAIGMSRRYPEIIDIVKSFGSSFLIQILSENYFQNFITKIDDALSKIDKDFVEMWNSKCA